MTDKKLKANSGNLQLGDVVTVDQTNSRLGVGTPSPGTLLDVAGAVTLGSSSGTAASHTIQGNNTSGTLRVKAGSFSGHIALERDTTSTGTVWLGTASGDFRIGTTAGGTDIGQATAAGAWTLGQIHNIGAGNITSGTYTPTVTEGTNVTSGNKGVAQVSHYMRVGNTVTVSVRVNSVITTAGGPTASKIYVSLPIASNFTNQDDLHGTGVFLRGASPLHQDPVVVLARVSPDEAEIFWNSSSTDSHDIYVTFQYEVK